jgi:hypothetical protein
MSNLSVDFYHLIILGQPLFHSTSNLQQDIMLFLKTQNILTSKYTRRERNTTIYVYLILN